MLHLKGVSFSGQIYVKGYEFYESQAEVQKRMRKTVIGCLKGSNGAMQVFLEVTQEKVAQVLTKTLLSLSFLVAAYFMVENGCSVLNHVI